MRKSLSILSFNGGMITTPLARSPFFRTADFNCRVNVAIRRLFEILIRYAGQTNTRLTSQGATLDLRLWFYLQAQAQQAPTRQQCAALMSRVSPRMTRDEVEAILGKPDDIRTKYDPGGAETGESWRYGANGHLTTATLGSVYIDENSKVQGVCGGAGDPPPAWMFA